jgi:hypothetical protein
LWSRSNSYTFPAQPFNANSCLILGYQYLIHIHHQNMATIFKCYCLASKALSLQCHEQRKYLCTHSWHFLLMNPVTDLLWHLNSKTCAYHSVVLKLPTNLVPNSWRILVLYCITTNQRCCRTMLYVTEKLFRTEIRKD